MRGVDDRSVGMFSYVRLEDRIAADHPLRAIRALVEEVLSIFRFDLLSFIHTQADHRSRPSSCSRRRCCKRSSRSVRSAS